jgi:hypothetical protein
LIYPLPPLFSAGNAKVYDIKTAKENISILPNRSVQISVATNLYLLAAYIKLLHGFNQGCRVD